MVARHYYNDNDPNAAAWLRELIAEGLLPDGDVDERSIEDVRPADLVGYTQYHFFAGIGGWPYALRLAGWPDDWPVWTGSCPCQPYSQAGSRKGDDDPRALWWAWRWLIDQRRPPVIFGEQVASKAGREWLAGVRADLEAMGYAVGAADLPAAGVCAPHIRQRLWWVAESQGEGRRRRYSLEGRGGQEPGGPGEDGGLAHTQRIGRRGRDDGRSNGDAGGLHAETEVAGSGTFGFWDDAVWIPCADGKARRIKPGLEPLVDGLPGRVALLRGAGNAIVPQVAAVFVRAYMEAVR